MSNSSSDDSGSLICCWPGTKSSHPGRIKQCFGEDNANQGEFIYAIIIIILAVIAMVLIGRAFG